MGIDFEQLLAALCPHLGGALRACYSKLLKSMFEVYLCSPLRLAHFLAQACHESNGLQCRSEIWGPTHQQLLYEPPSRLAATLGNTEPGDGIRFRGRGFIQLTGRSNYERFGRMIGLDLVENPGLAAVPEHAFELAGIYWRVHAINIPADRDDLEACTRLVNGGLNGLEPRRRLLVSAKQALRLEGI